MDLCGYNPDNDIIPMQLLQSKMKRTNMFILMITGRIIISYIKDSFRNLLIRLRDKSNRFL